MERRLHGTAPVHPASCPPAGTRRVFEREKLSRLLSQKNLELLEAIFEHEPESIREAAELVDRDDKQVHRNLSELEDIGAIEFEGGGSGQAKKPVLAYDGLETDIPFADSDESVGTVAP